MSGNLKVMGEMDDTALVEKEAEWKARLNILNREAQAVDRSLAQVTRKAARMATAIGQLIRVFAKVLPKSMQSIVTAGVDLVTQAVITLNTVAVSYASGIVTAPLAVAVSIAALAMSSMGMAAALDAQGKVDTATQAMISDMMAVTSAINTLTGIIGGGSMSEYYG